MSRWILPISLLFVLLLSGCTQKTEEVNLNPDDKKLARGHLSLGVSHLRESKPSQALKEFLIADELDPNNPEILVALSKAYEMRKAYGLAEEKLLRAIELRPDEPNYQNNLGALYVRSKRWDDAIVAFQKAVDNLIFGRSDLALTGIGYAYQKKNRHDKAIASFKLALENNPSYARAWLHLGESHFALGDIDSAILDFNKAIGLVPEFAMAHYRLGLAYLKQKDSEKAAEAFRKTIKLAPESEAAREAKNYLDILE